MTTSKPALPTAQRLPQSSGDGPVQTAMHPEMDYFEYLAANRSMPSWESPARTDMHPEKDFFGFLAAGRFMLQKCRGGNVFDPGGHVFYPRVAEPGTGNPELEWVEALGLGTVYSTTVIRQKPPAPNYNLALIDLAEGVRMTARVEGIAPEAVKIGMAVKARVVRENDQALVVFEPLDEAQASK